MTFLSFHCLISPQADAILDAHYPGAATGAAAVADTLYGLNNPSGKLTYSVMPALFANLSNFASMSMTAPPGRGYVDENHYTIQCSEICTLRNENEKFHTEI